MDVAVSFHPQWDNGEVNGSFWLPWQRFQQVEPSEILTKINVSAEVLANQEAELRQYKQSSIG